MNGKKYNLKNIRDKVVKDHMKAWLEFIRSYVYLKREGFLDGIMPPPNSGHDDSTVADKAAATLDIKVIEAREAIDWIVANPSNDPNHPFKLPVEIQIFS